MSPTFAHIILALRKAGLLVAAMLVATSVVQVTRAQEAVVQGEEQDGIASSISLSIVGGDSLSVDPGETVTVVYRVAALTDSTSLLTPDFDIPKGWSIVFGGQDIELSGSDPITRFVTYKVPDNALAGVYSPRFDVHSANGTFLDSIASKVHVRSLHDLSIEAGPAPSFLAAGKSFEVPLTVANDGNARIEVVLAADNRRFTHIELASDNVSLGPGEHATVTAQVTTDADADRSQRIVLRFDARMASDKEVSTYTSVAFDIVPVFARMRPKAANTPLSLSVETIGDESGVSPQASLHAAGKLLGGDVRVAATIAESPRRKLYGQEPHVTVQYARDDVSVTLGDHSTYTSPMTLTGERGVGAAAHVVKDAWSMKGSIQRSRTIIPVQERAALSATWHRNDTSDLSANLLYRNEFYQGTLFTIRSLSQPFGPTSKLDVECGISNSRALQDPSCMVQTTGSTNRFSYQVRTQRASIDFPGTMAGTRMASTFTSMRLTNAWRIEQMTTLMRRDVGTGSSRHNLYAKAGFNYSARIADGNLYATVHGIRSQSRYALLEGTTERIQNTLRLSTGYQMRSKGLTVSFERGTASSAAQVPPGSLTRIRLNGRYSLTANLNLNGSFEHSQGNLSSSATDQTNRQFGMGATLQLRSDVRAGIAGFRSVIKSNFEQQYASFRASVSKTFRSGKELSLRAQFNHNEGRQSLRTADYRLAFTTPLGIPFTGRLGANDVLNGRVVDHETGQPIADVLLFLGNDLAITDAKGRFRFAKPGQDVVFLRIDASTIGYDRTPVLPMPMEIGPHNFTGEELVIPISGTAIIQGHVHIYKNQETGQNLLGDGSGSLSRTAGLQGAVIQIENDAVRQRSRTASDGSFVFTQLPPGMYSVSVVRSNLDADQRLETDAIKVMVEVGETSTLEFRVVPSRKRIKMIKSSSLSLSPGVTIESPGTPETPEPEKNIQESPDPAPGDDHGEESESQTPGDVQTNAGTTGSATWLGQMKEAADTKADESASDATLVPFYLQRGTPHPDQTHPVTPLLFVLCILFLLIDMDLLVRSVIDGKQHRIKRLEEPRWMGTTRLAVLYTFLIAAATTMAGPLAGLSVSLALSGICVAVETKTIYRAMLNVVLLKLVSNSGIGSWTTLRNAPVRMLGISLDEIRVEHVNGLESSIPTHRIHVLTSATRRNQRLACTQVELSFSRMSNLRQIRSMLESRFESMCPDSVDTHLHIVFTDIDAAWTSMTLTLISASNHEDRPVVGSIVEAEFMAAGIPLLTGRSTTVLPVRSQNTDSGTSIGSGTFAGAVPDPGSLSADPAASRPALRLIKGGNQKAA